VGEATNLVPPEERFSFSREKFEKSQKTSKSMSI
jgi:hypothetical protein